MSKKITQYPREGIAIIGLGCYYPKSGGIDQFWKNIIGKVDCITEVSKDRWDPAIYYDPDKNAPDKTYSKIGGFVDHVDFTVLTRKYKIPPTVLKAMDVSQKYALLATGDALQDAGYGERDFDRSRTAVIIGNSMGGDQTDYTVFRVFMNSIEWTLKNDSVLSKIDPETRKLIIDEFDGKIKSHLPEISEDTMPGELANVIAGRISNALNLTGPSFAVDAACASSLASLKEAANGLRYGDFDMAVAGGTDFLMGPGPYVKFSKIGALSGEGSRPFDARANGFVMGEGTGIFILKRVSDARRDGNKIYAIVTGIGASADGKGKGITAPNPRGQTLAIGRAFEEAGYTPSTVQYVEAHGTSTTVGDLAEMEGLLSIWNNGMKNNSIGVGSIKSNIGHLKAASGSASIIKLSLALSKKIIPPSINFNTPNPEIPFGKIPFRVITEAEEWPDGIEGNPRRGNASAFGFGGTNFHVAMEEDTGDNGMPAPKKYFQSTEFANSETVQTVGCPAGGNITAVCDYSDKRYELSAEENKKLEGETVVIGGSSWNDINSKLTNLKQEIKGSRTGLRDLVKKFNIESNSKDFRLGIAAFSMDDFIEKSSIAPEGFENLKRRMVLKNKGLFYGEGLLDKKRSLGKLCLMFPGQGTQYVNMLKDLYNKYKIVKDSFHEADEIMYGVMGRGISGIIFQRDDASREELDTAENQLVQTEIMQPGVLTADYAMFRLLKSYGIHPDVVVGHSLGEYGALVAAGVMSFRDALYAVSARGKEIADIKWDDVGAMASVPAPVEKTEELLKGIPGYVIIANKNCNSQTVVAGETRSVKEVLKKCDSQGIPAQEIPVSHAFHSNIVEPIAYRYRKILENFVISSPKIDIVANLTGEYYPKGDNVRDRIVDILVKHIHNPVEFIKQVERMYADGVNVFIEAGPKRTLSSFVLNILDKRPHLAMATTHPKRGGIGAFNDALAALATNGLDIDWNGTDENANRMSDPEWRLRDKFMGRPGAVYEVPAVSEKKIEVTKTDMNRIEQKNYSLQGEQVGNSNMKNELYDDFKMKQTELLKDILEIYSRKSEELLKEQLKDALFYRKEMERFNISLEKIMISGVAMGLPGERFKVFDDDIYDRIAQGINMIDPVPDNVRQRIADKNITRLVKKSDGEASFETITDKAEVVKLVGRKGKFNFSEEYGFDQEFADKLEITTQLAIAAGIEALKDAGIPLVMNYKRTSTGKLLPTYWALPEPLQNDTGIIFAAAFPGENSVIEELSREYAYKYGMKSKKELIKLYSSLIEKVKDEKIREQLSEWYAENYSLLKDGMDKDIYEFNKKFIFKILVMGHSQFAELIKAKGPNIHINSACSSTTVGIGIAEDWIRTGRAKRVIVVAADDVTSNAFIEWILSGFLAVGAVTTEGKIEDAALPFDKRRNGFIVGMGAAGIVVEAESELKKRGMEPIVEVVSTEFANSAFHGTRIDNDHVSMIMEKVIARAESRLNLKRDQIAKELLFMSHETYTPARGGSASSEINALRNTFKESYKNVLVSNTKGFTGHTMAVGVEDVVAVRALQTAKVPPIANFKEIDPDLGEINLSKGGKYDHIKYALRLGAGFGSQIAVSVLKLVSRREDRILEKGAYTNWLKELSGIENPEIEIVNRALRIKDDGSVLKKGRAVTVKSEPVIEKPAINVVETPAPTVQTVSVVGIIQEKILKIVADKTGYPADLIEFDLDMESDLGIDTVKQAEMFGMIRETFSIPADEGIRIKDFPTLNHVVEFVKQRSPMKFAEASASVSSVPSVQSVPVEPVKNVSAAAVPGGLNEIQKKIIKIVEEKTGYPQDLIEFDLDMESDLGIDTVKQAEMFGMIRETFSIPADETIRIKDFPTLNHVVEFVRQKSPLKFSEVQPVPSVLTPAQAAKPAASQIVPSAAPQVEQHGAVTSVSSGSPEFDEIRRKVIKIVEEKTGYPEDLIEFDLDMESDLGIDTVKQAEMFGMIRETFNIPADETIRIKDFPTLNHVIQFVVQKSGKTGITGVKSASSTVSSQTMSTPAKAAVSVSAASASAASASAASAPAASAPAAELDEIRKKIIKIVEEKTGYPEDLIEFDLDMESDLGIDTVKQAEMFGMIRETFNIPADETIRIKDFPTLNHVIEFVKSKSSLFKGSSAEVKAFAEKPAERTEEKKTVKSNIKRMTVEAVEEPLDKKSAPRFDFNGFNILITDDGRGISGSLEKTLKEAGASIGIIQQNEMENTDALGKAVERVQKPGKVNGIIHLTSLEESKDINEMSYEDWRTSIFKRVKSLFFISKTLQKDIMENAKNGKAFVVSVTDMGGTFGIDDFTANNPIGGGVAGLTKGLDKEFNREGKEVLVKAIDLDSAEKPNSVAKIILNEIQLGSRKTEAGYVGKTRMVMQVIYKEIDLDVQPRTIVGEGSVFVVTGGGYGITSAIAKDIAKNLRAKLAVISLESLPENAKELASLDANGLRQLKDKVINDLKSKHERVTPVMIDKEYAKYTIAIDIYKNIEEMKKLGAPDVEYYSCNVMDHNAMTDVINNIRTRFGRIDAVIHGAGINKDKLLEDKSFEDFSLVVDVKADGCYNIMEAVKKDGVKVMVTFASISGRFGNIGQTDYSAANDLLNKYVQHSNRRFFPDMKAVSMNWSGWLGVGMATRGSITRIFEESGVDMIPMEEGITKVREELLYGNDAEVIVAGKVGAIDSDNTIVGEKTKDFTAAAKRINSRDKYPLVDELVSLKSGKSIVVKKKLDTERDLYLKDHAIENIPYLPAVMGIEIFAETATLLFPASRIKLMKEIKFNIPVKILKGKPIDLIVTAEKVNLDNDELTVKAKLETEFFNKDGVKLGDNKLHFEALIILSDKGPDKRKLKGDDISTNLIQRFEKDRKPMIDEKEIYKRFFHGPKFQVHGGVIDLEDKKIYGVMSERDGKTGGHFSYIKKPDFITNPMAIEAAFQNAGIYTMAKKNKISLPDTIEELVFTPVPEDVKDLYISAKYIGSDDMKHEYNTEILDNNGNVYSVMKGYKMINIGDLKDNEKF